MAIDFMKEHLRKMLTDLDQDLEGLQKRGPFFTAGGKKNNYFCCFVCTKKTGNYTCFFWLFCCPCVFSFKLFLLFVLEFVFIEQDDFLPQNVRLRFYQSYTSTIHVTITVPNF